MVPKKLYVPRVVVAVPSAAHAALDAMTFQQAPVRDAHVLTATIGVVHPSRCGFSRSQSHDQRLLAKAGAHVPLHGPPHNHPRSHIDDRSQGGPASCCAQIGIDTSARLIDTLFEPPDTA